jgi:hypothetical protein
MERESREKIIENVGRKNVLFSIHLSPITGL